MKNVTSGIIKTTMRRCINKIKEELTVENEEKLHKEIDWYKMINRISNNSFLLKGDYSINVIFIILENKINFLIFNYYNVTLFFGVRYLLLHLERMSEDL